MMQRAGTRQHFGYDYERSAESQVNEYCDVGAKAESGIGMKWRMVAKGSSRERETSEMQRSTQGDTWHIGHGCKSAMHMSPCLSALFPTKTLPYSKEHVEVE